MRFITVTGILATMAAAVGTGFGVIMAFAPTNGALATKETLILLLIALPLPIMLAGWVGRAVAQKKRALGDAVFVACQITVILLMVYIWLSFD